MQRGDEVVWLPSPWAHGIGTIKGTTSQAWLWVEWADGHFDSYDPMQLELAARWEADQLGITA